MADNKPDLDSETQAKADALVADYQKMVGDASKTLDAFDRLHEFQMSDACDDETGNPTTVFRVNLDRDGFLGMYIRLGQPVTVREDDFNFDDEKLFAYLSFMSNIDLKKDSNLKAIGISAIGKAREVVRAFFTLRLVADL